MKLRFTALSPYRLPIALWLVLLFTVTLWSSLTHLQESKSAFSQLASQVQTRAQHHIQANEVILQTLSQLVGPSDLFQHQSFESVVDALTEHHPQIRAVLLFPSLPLEQQDELTIQFKKAQDIELPQIEDPTDLDFISPILFSRTRGEELLTLQGSDARAIEPLAQTIHAIDGAPLLSSPPYAIQGKNHYFLVTNAQRALSLEDELFPWYPEIHIALLIDPNQIIQQMPIVDISLSRYTPNSSSRELLCTTPPNNDYASRITQPLQYTARLDSTSQPFILDISTTIPRIYLSSLTITVVVLSSLLFFYLTHRRVSLNEEQTKIEQENEARLLLKTKNRIQMLNAISHDIRTPLTRLQLRTSAMLQGDAKKKSISDLNEIEQLVEGSLDYLRHEEHQEAPVIIDINEMSYTIQSEMADQGKLFTIHGEARWPYMGQPLQLKRAIQNLINNAFRFAENVELHLYDHVRNLTIEVVDNGPGIEEALLQKVMHPYYRVDDSRNRESGGIGLGLSIVREVTEAHDGHFSISNRAEGGLKAAISLPR